jgi:hypothetical protein
VRLQRTRLDHQIAHGCPPEAFAECALRASQLIAMSTRRRTAGSLRRVVEDCERPHSGMFSSAVPLCRRAVWPWREGLLGLAERLERPGPIEPCAVARVLDLVTDGFGPLYNPGSERSMGEALWWIADGLQPARGA